MDMPPLASYDDPMAGAPKSPPAPTLEQALANMATDMQRANRSQLGFCWMLTGLTVQIGLAVSALKELEPGDLKPHDLGTGELRGAAEALVSQLYALDRKP